MTDYYLLESSAGHYQLEDASGSLLLETTPLVGDQRFPGARAFPTDPMQRGWAQSLLLTTLALPGAAALTWHDFQVPTPPARLQQSWTQSTPLVMQPAPPVQPVGQGTDSRLPARSTPILQGWTQASIQNPYAMPPGTSNDWRVPTRAPIPVPSWTQASIQNPQAFPPGMNFDWRVPVAPDRRMQSWASPIPVVALAPSIGAWQDFRLPIAPPRIPQSWASPGTVPVVVAGTPTPLQDFRLPARAAPIQQSWATNLLQTTLAPVVLPPIMRSPMQAPMRLHWGRDRSSMSFDAMMYMDPATPVNVVFRAGLKAPQFPPPRLLQRWQQNTPFALSQQTVVLRTPMDAPSFWDQRMQWRQAYNPNNLLPQQAANPPGIRYHVIGSFVVRRFK